MAEAQQIPPQGTDRSLSSEGGVDSRRAPFLLQPNQATELENLIINEIGKTTPRRGTRSFGGLNSPPGGFGFYVDSQFDENFAAVFGSLLWRSEGSGDFRQIGSDTSLVSNLLHQVYPVRWNGNNSVAVNTAQSVTDTGVGLDGFSQLVLWDSVSDVATQLSLAPRCTAFFQERIFAGEGEQLVWSEIGEISAFSEANQLLVEPGIGGQITAIVPARDLQPLLWVFKERAIFLFEVRWGDAGAGKFIATAGDALDTTNSSIRPLTVGTGCIATRSATWTPGQAGADIFFLSADGIRALSRADNDVQQGASFPLSYNIPGWIDRINFAAADKSVASVFDNAYHLAVPLDGATDNTHILRFDFEGQSWSLHTMQARDLQTASLGGTSRLFLQNTFPTSDSTATGVDSDIYHIYQMYSTDTDPSTSITEPVRPRYNYESRQFVLGDPFTRKTFDEFSFQFSSSATNLVEIAYSLDQKSFIALTETYLPGSQGAVILGTTPLPWDGNAEQIRRCSFGLADIGTGYGVQFRIASVSGSSEVGQPTFYIQELNGRLLPRNFENDK